MHVVVTLFFMICFHKNVYNPELNPLPHLHTRSTSSYLQGLPLNLCADDLKYFVAGPKLSTITTKLQQSMDDLAVYANQWRIGLNAGKTSKLLFQRSTRYIPDWHITLHGKAIRSVTSAKFLVITFDTTLSFKHFHTVTNLARHRLRKLLSISTSTHGPSPSTTRLFNIYIRALLGYGGAATCVAKKQNKKIKKVNKMKSLQLANKKSKRNLTKKSVKKNQKTKIDYSSSGGPFFLLFSCYALAALQSPTINQDNRHKTTTRSTISTSFNVNSMLQKEKTRQRQGISTYTGAGRVKHYSILTKMYLCDKIGLFY